ncbi:DUF4229 domain-containing protein (plasmid) [Coraliomargarita sp. W4R53]
MKTRSTLVYTVLRLLTFLVPFGALMLLPIMREYYWLAAIFAALIGLSLSMIFLRRPLDEMTAGIAERRAQANAPLTDEDVEDAAADSAAPSSPPQD